MIFAVGAVAGLLYTEFFVDVETLEQLSVNPFSLQVFVSDSVPKWSSYFFNTLNLFEFGYVLVLAYLIEEEKKSNEKRKTTIYLQSKAVQATMSQQLHLYIEFFKKQQKQK